MKNEVAPERGLALLAPPALFIRVGSAKPPTGERGTRMAVREESFRPLYNRTLPVGKKCQATLND
jgi:hypothetical protein